MNNKQYIITMMVINYSINNYPSSFFSCHNLGCCCWGATSNKWSIAVPVWDKHNRYVFLKIIFLFCEWAIIQTTQFTVCNLYIKHSCSLHWSSKSLLYIQNTLERILQNCLDVFRTIYQGENLHLSPEGWHQNKTFSLLLNFSQLKVSSTFPMWRTRGKCD